MPTSFSVIKDGLLSFKMDRAQIEKALISKARTKLTLKLRNSFEMVETNVV